MKASRRTAFYLSLCLVLALADAPAATAAQGLHPIIALLPKGQINKPYPSVTLIAGGTPPYTAQIAGAVPKGMSIGSAGALFGTPRDVGIYRFKLDFTDSAGATLELSYVLQIGR